MYQNYSLKLLLSTILICFGILSTSAQDTTIYYTKKGKPYTRAEYIEDMTSYIHIAPFIYSSRNHFEIQDQRILTFEPNESANIGIRVMHKWLGLAFSYGPKNLQADKKGSTDYINFQLNSYGKKFGFDIYYTDYSGYYLENYRKFPKLDSIFGDVFPQRPDISTLSLGGNFHYIFNNNKFSYRSSFIQNEIQKKSAGSFLLTGSFSYFNIRGDSTIIHPAIRQYYESRSQFKDGDFYSISVLPGYAHTLVAWHRFYLTFSISAGVTAQYQSYNTAGRENIEKLVFLPRAMSRLGFGYNGKRFYSGLTSMVESYNLPLGQRTKLTYFIGSASLFMGVRLGVPKSLKKISDKMDNISPTTLFQKNN